MKILIYGVFKYPHGSAAAVRLRLIARGLTKQGFKVRILALTRAAPRKEDLQSDNEYRFENVTYECVNPANDGLLAGLWTFCRGAMRLHELIETRAYDTVLVYDLGLGTLLPVLLLSWKYGVKVVVDAIEWFEASVFRLGPIHPSFIDHRAGGLLAAYFADGVIAISTYLERLFHAYKRRVVRIPSLIDPNGLPGRPIQVGGRRRGDVLNLLYVGGLKPPDCGHEMISAVGMARAAGVPVILTLVGCDRESAAARELMAATESLGLDPAVLQWAGRIPDADYLRRIGEADAVILLRASDVRSQASFPTRIPELLSTGRPLITSAVPDIPLYLEDGEHAFVVHPGDPVALASRLQQIWLQPPEAERVAANGRARSFACFSLSSHGLALARFLRNDVLGAGEYSII